MSTATDPEANDTDVSAKPPFLRRVRIRGYKSIGFCDVTLEPLTILVGRNASGKSNFLDALDFISDLVELRATEAVERRGGWRFIHSRSNPRAHIDVEFEANLSGYGPRLVAKHAFTLAEGPRNEVQLLRESLTLDEQGGTRRCGYRVADNRIEWIGEPSDWDVRPGEHDHLQYHRQQYRDRLLLGLVGSQPISELAEEFRASHVHNFSPAEMRPPQPLRGSLGLTPSGSNLALAILRLEEIEPESVKRIGQYLSQIVPQIERFHTTDLGLDYLTIQFHLRTPAEHSGLQFDAASMSDGTLRTLAALVAAHQIYLPTNASGFVGIEEPETSLHPAAMRALVDALDEATLRTQILLTTHSAEMLDNPTIKPENVRVVEMIDGQTVIAPVDEASVEIVRRKLDTLGGLERQNQLQPDPDDVERQKHLSLNGREPKG